MREHIENRLEKALLESLMRLGAADIAHAGKRSLIDHLFGTYLIARAWELPSPVQTAGLFHSVYSTTAFKTELLHSNQDRERLSGEIGKDSEELVWLFSEISFQRCVDTLFVGNPDAEAHLVAGTRTQPAVEIGNEQLVQLALLHVANLAEQACSDDKGPGLWMAAGARVLRGVQRYAALPVSQLVTFAEVVTPSLESRCRRMYAQAMHAASVADVKAEQLFVESGQLLLNAEPFVYAAALAEESGRPETAAEYRARAEERLQRSELSWDKRRTVREWRAALADPDSLLQVLRSAPRRPEPPKEELHVNHASKRLSAYLDSFANGCKSASNGAYMGGLPQERFPQKKLFPVVEQLEEQWQTIRQELLAVDSSHFHEEAEPIARVGSWGVMMFYERGLRNEENCRLCPTIARLIEAPECMRTMSGLIYASRLSPGTRVSVHRGPTNLRMRCHLGISIPAGLCGLEVGGDVRVWTEGECLVFDDSFDHSVWNLSQRDRIVLIVDFWHPDLTHSEIASLTAVQEYARVMGPPLVKYWKKNAKAKAGKRRDYD